MQAVAAWAQPADETIQLLPAWKKGQTVRFEANTSMEMMLGGEFPMNSTSKAGGQLIVKDADAENYYILFKQDEGDQMELNMEVGHDTLQQMMDEVMPIMKAFLEPFAQIGIGYVVSRQGEVLDLWNKEETGWEIQKAMERSMKTLPAEFQEKITPHDLDSIISVNFEAFAASGVNHMNVFFMGHQCEFPKTGVYRQQAEFTDADAPLKEDSRTSKGWMEYKLLSRNDKQMVGQVELIYDKADLIQQLSQEHPELTFDPETLEFSEVRTFTFDLVKGWITNVTEVITFKIPELSTKTTTVTTLKL